MFRSSLRLIATCALLLPNAAAFAQETTFGLAMAGAPKYEASDTHLDYANPKAPIGGEITMAAIGTFDSLNPYAIKGTAAQGLNLVYDRLMARVWDEPFTMYPLIAERVDVPEDRSSITVYLNPKARFNDGTQVTAEDVIFSFETLKNEGRPNMRQIYKLISKVEQQTDGGIKFSFGEGYDQETAMIVAMMPVLSKAYWSERTFDSSTLDIPVTNGPYKIAKVEAGRSITYERDPNYWAKDLLTNIGHHNIERITYDYYRDDGVAFEAFKSGDIDLRREFDAGKWASAYDFPAITEGKVVKEALPHGRPERVRSFIFNTRRAPFDDIRVRKALNLLFDFDWVNKNLFHSQYKQINSFFPNSELASPENETVEGIDRRTKMRQANTLLNEAGWQVVDGKRVKDGKPFEFEILLGAPEDEKIALHFKSALERMGITANIRVLDSAAFTGRLTEYDYDMTLYFWLSSLSPGTEQPLYWGCAAAKQPSRWNYAGICDPEIDRLAGSIASAKTREELVKTVQTLDHKLWQGQYIIPLYYAGKDFVSYWKPINHPDKTPLYGMVLESWWIEKPQSTNQD